MRTVAVVVLNWNGLADTLALLPTLERCRLPEGWQLSILVVDNGSTDGSVEKIRAGFPAVQVLALGENRRFAGGNNAGLARPRRSSTLPRRATASGTRAATASWRSGSRRIGG